MTRFNYLLDKICAAPFSTVPFEHLEILDFLSPEHFEAIVTDPQIRLERLSSTEALFERLEEHGWSAIGFPGCVKSRDEYLDWYHGRTTKTVHPATESFGMVYRLTDRATELVEGLAQFFKSEELKAALVEKFGITRPVGLDGGIQKYLHGYEISPHPDVRRKALTWMLNINPGDSTEDQDFHTHYMQLKDRWRFIAEFWRYNPEWERDWLPWDWCETVKRQRRNNSIVFFLPSDNTLHAVKAKYDHLQTQRTQLYGNLWYERESTNALPKLEFNHFDIAAQQRGRGAARPVPSRTPPQCAGGTGETTTRTRPTRTGPRSAPDRQSPDRP